MISWSHIQFAGECFCFWANCNSGEWYSGNWQLFFRETHANRTVNPFHPNVENWITAQPNWETKREYPPNFGWKYFQKEKVQMQMEYLNRIGLKFWANKCNASETFHYLSLQWRFSSVKYCTPWMELLLQNSLNTSFTA